MFLQRLRGDELPGGLHREGGMDGNEQPCYYGAMVPQRHWCAS